MMAMMNKVIISSSLFVRDQRNGRLLTSMPQLQFCALFATLVILLLLLHINLATAAEKQFHAAAPRISPATASSFLNSIVAPSDPPHRPGPKYVGPKPMMFPKPGGTAHVHSSQVTVDRRYELQILRRLLAAGYTYYARPLTNDNGTLEVRTRISLIKIQNLWERTDVKTEALEVTMRIQLNWCDGALSWEPDSFGGVDYVIIPGDRLWIPDIQIINALDDVYSLIRDRRFDFKLHSDGCVWWFPTGTIFTRCELDLSYFPFDIQRCPIIFESAMYPKEFLNLTVRYDKSAVSLKTFTPSGQWDLITAYAIPTLNYVTTSTAFSRVEITLEIRRKTLYYKINVFFPCGMLSALQILTFFLPIGSEDRISQSTTILLSVVVFQSIVVGELPRTSNSIPLLCLYIDFLTGISVVTVADAILGVYVLNSTNRHGCLARFLQCLVLLRHSRSSKKSAQHNSQKSSAIKRNNSNRGGGGGDSMTEMELLPHQNNISSVSPTEKLFGRAVKTPTPILTGATIVNEAAEDTFEEDSLDALSRHGGGEMTTHVDLLVVASPEKSPSNHTLIISAPNKNRNNNKTANYGTTSTGLGQGAAPALLRRSTSAGGAGDNNRNQSQPSGEQYRKALQKRLFDPLFAPNNIVSRSGAGGDDASDISEGTNALRTAAVCIDNVVFLIALTSSIMIPFYMFNVLPPS